MIYSDWNLYPNKGCLLAQLFYGIFFSKLENVLFPIFHTQVHVHLVLCREVVHCCTPPLI